MTFVATVTVDILRGNTTDAYGDAADVDAVVVAGIPASILQRVQRGTGKSRAATQDRPVSGVTRTVRAYLGRVAAGTDVREQDRLRTVPDGPIYLVEGVSDPTGLSIGNDLRLDLVRIT